MIFFLLSLVLIMIKAALSLSSTAHVYVCCSAFKIAIMILAFHCQYLLDDVHMLVVKKSLVNYHDFRSAHLLVLLKYLHISYYYRSHHTN